MGTSPNPNWPVLCVDCDFTQGPPHTGGNSRLSLNAPARRNAVRGLGISRGRQYELDQTQAGTCTLDVVDPLEYLNPGNSSSPFMTGGNTIKPYRCLSVYALWPTTGNLFASTVNSSYDPSFEVTTGGVTAGGGTTLAVSTAQHQFGAKALLVTQGGNTSAAWPSILMQAAPGLTVTVSVYAYLTGSCSLQVQCPDGTNSTVLSTQTAWTRVTVTYTATDSLQKIVFAGTATAHPTYYLDGLQAEFAATASAFSTTGPTLYNLWTGYVERWPLHYDMSGTRGIRPLTGVDALAVLSRTQVSQSYAKTLAASSPRLNSPLTDPGPPGVVNAGRIGKFSYIENLAQGAAVQWGGDAFLDGVNCLSTSTDMVAAPAYAECFMPQQSIWVNNANMSVDLWLWGQYAGVAANMWATTRPPATTLAGWSVTYGAHVASGAPTIQVSYRPLSGPAVDWFTTVTPQAWHHVAVVCAAGYQATVWVDNVQQATQTVPSDQLYCSYLLHGATTDVDKLPAKVSVYQLAMWDRQLSTTEIAAHYNRGTGFSGELSGARVTRLLNTYWAGPMSVAAGFARLAPDFAYDTRMLLDCLQEVQETERGLLYADRNGTVVFEDRSSRYSTANQASLWVLGENPNGASPVEYPYTDYVADYDPTYTFSQANLSRPGNSVVSPQTSAQSQTDYGQRVITQTVQVTTDFDVQQAGVFYLSRYSAPKVRVEKLTLNPAANPALWPLVLSLELSQRVTVRRRTAALTTSNDYYIEQVNHKIDAASGVWTVDLQASPVFVPQAWVLGDTTFGVLGTTTVPVY